MGKRAMRAVLKGKAETVRTTIDLSKPLWRTAKIRAMDEGTTLHGLMAGALVAYLKTRKEASQ